MSTSRRSLTVARVAQHAHALDQGGHDMDADTHPRNSRLSRYSTAYAATVASITERARAAADLADTPLMALENLELLRLTLHREVDHLLDAEADRHGQLLTLIPPPRDETTNQ
ncbi:hypothetical protein ACFV1N_05895 [Streptosporangium canum]|uniref:hypothetical protein n=1 Tax=Streptosporangium canum TaxID=324952 RepID=UPI00367D2878